MTWGIVAATAATVVGSSMQSRSARRASDAQAQSSADAIAEQQRQFDLQREDAQPYRETSVNALRQLAGDINTPTTAADVMADPGYQFGLEQGQQALDRRFAASGGRLSGAGTCHHHQEN